MTSLLNSIPMRKLMPMVAIAFALFALNGCSGDQDQSADTPEAGEHDEAVSQAPHDDQADDEHDEAEYEDHADDDLAEAEHDEVGHDEAEEGEDEHHGEEAEFTEPHNYAEAIHVIHEQLEKIEALIDSDKLDDVHAEAAVIRDVANTLAKFALAKDSGVPQDAVKDINLTAKKLAATFEAIDEAGDSGNLAGTQKVYDEMYELFESLEQYVEEHDDD